MRTIWRGVMLVWLVLIGLVFTLPFPPIMRNPVRETWQGATPGWSPKDAVAAVETPSGWDVEGWRVDGDRELHGALNRVEHRLWSDLDALLAEVYAWRDQ